MSEAHRIRLSVLVGVLLIGLLRACLCHGETVLYTFTASWCGPCQGMKPVIARIAAAGHQVVNVDCSQRVPSEWAAHDIKGLPTFLVATEGRITGRVVGATSEARLVELLGRPGKKRAAEQPRGFQIMSAAKLDACRRSLPALDDKDMQALFLDPSTLYYSDREIPAAYQFHGTFHSPLNNLSGDPTDDGLPDGFGGNPNVDFPWLMPGGSDRAEGRVAGFKMLALPQAANGVRWPVVLWRERLPYNPHGAHVGLKWIFPVGTVIAEVLTLADSRGVTHTFEIRVRKRRKDYWDVDIFRPFPTREEFLARLAEVDPQTAQSVPRRTHLRQQRLVGRHRTHPGFDGTALVDELPALPEATAAALLDSTPFKSAEGAWWASPNEGEGHAFAPTSRQAFSIVPQNYDGTFMGSDYVACRRCHDATLVSARHFDAQRGWYGHVRGSADGIFSFHPVEPRAVSVLGFDLPVQIRQAFLQAGIVAWFDPHLHPASHYSRLSREEKPIQ